MKKHLFLILISCFSFISCKQDNEQKIEISIAPKANLDSMNKAWLTGWNTQNTEALKNLVADNAVVFMYNWRLEGKDSIIKNWINVSSPAIKNLKTEFYKKESSKGIAFSSRISNLILCKEIQLLHPISSLMHFFEKQKDNSIKI